MAENKDMVYSIISGRENQLSIHTKQMSVAEKYFTHYLLKSDTLRVIIRPATVYMEAIMIRFEAAQFYFSYYYFID